MAYTSLSDPALALANSGIGASKYGGIAGFTGAIGAALAPLAPVAPIIGMGIGLLTNLVNGIQSRIAANREQNELTRQLDANINWLKGELENGSLSDAEFADRLDTLFGQVTESGDRETIVAVKEFWNEELEKINTMLDDQQQSAINQIQFQLDEAKLNADEQRLAVIREKEKNLKAIGKDLKQSSQETRTALTNRRLGGSGALIAAMNKTQQVFGDVAKDLLSSADSYLQNIGKQLAGVERSAIFQSGQTADEIARQKAGAALQTGQQVFGAEQALDAAIRTETAAHDDEVSDATAEVNRLTSLTPTSWDAAAEVNRLTSLTPTSWDAAFKTMDEAFALPEGDLRDAMTYAQGVVSGDIKPTSILQRGAKRIWDLFH